MRTLRLSLVGTVMLVLLGGLSGAVIAQEEVTPTDPHGPSFFTLTKGDTLSESEWEWSQGPDGSSEFLGLESVFTVEATDPRISGTWAEVYDFRGWEAPDDSGLPFSPSIISGAVRIDNEDGAWVGTSEEFGSAFNNYEWIELQGEGAYDGLTAVVRSTQDFAAGIETYDGVIVPGVPPDHPDAVAMPE
jgi:hypothetical protein